MSKSEPPTGTLQADPPAAASPQGALDRQQLAAIAFERTRMPMVVCDARRPDTPIVLANQAFLDLTGYAADEVIGRNCRLLQGAGTSPAAVAELRAALEARRAASVEILNYRKDGSAFWNQLHLSPVRDDHGQLSYYFGSQIDVTAFRRVESLEASEHRLLMEVDHRARNVLAVVSGIVRLTRADDAAAYAAAVQQRVQALARAHALLAERNWRGVSLEVLIRQQIAPFDGPRIRLDGPEVEVAPVMVQALALTLHELIVNAATHGALTAPAGQLEVSWAPAPSGRGFVLRWEERGGPRPAPDPRPGFGIIMMGGMVERQLQGRLTREWRDDGVLVAIEAPARSAA